MPQKYRVYMATSRVGTPNDLLQALNKGRPKPVDCVLLAPCLALALAVSGVWWWWFVVYYFAGI